MGEPNAPTIDELLAEWEDLWLASLKYQVYELHHRREIHDEFMELLDASDHPDAEIFRDAYHGMYIEAQVMAIRRQADDDPRTLSLRRLIGQVETHRRRFTRSWYVSRWMMGRDPESGEERERLAANSICGWPMTRSISSPTMSARNYSAGDDCRRTAPNSLRRPFRSCDTRTRRSRTLSELPAM